MQVKNPVKKALTLFMLVLFLLNVLGFYGIFLGLKFRSSQETMRTLDEEKYSGEDAVTFAIPLTVPYYTAPTDEYERVNGEFEHDGEVYRLVKQKLRRDTLFVVCIKDRQGNRLNQEMADYVKTFTDKPMNAKQQSSKTTQSFCKDYLSHRVSVESGHQGWDKAITFLHVKNLYHHQSPVEIYYPPKHILFF